MKKASVVIPSRGGAARLPRLCAALAAQTYGDWEAIVVVDGDIDNSAAVVARYAHLPIRSIVFPENRGRVAALNAGFAHATGDVFIRCDDDLVPAPDFVAEHVRSTTDGSATVGLYRNVFPETCYARVYGRPADDRHRGDAYRSARTLRYRYWAGNCSVTRTIYDRIGGYDPRYRAYGWEDVDFGYRLHQNGVDIELVRALETPHHLAATTALSRVRRAFASGRARWTFDSIHGSGTSGPARPENSSAWNRLVNRLADRLTENGSARMAAAIDRLLPALPAPVGRKLVAALVEASGVAGYRVARGEA